MMTNNYQALEQIHHFLAVVMTTSAELEDILGENLRVIELSPRTLGGLKTLLDAQTKLITTLIEGALESQDAVEQLIANFRKDANG